MALNINGRMKVKTLRTDFKEEFGLALRVYDGRSFADDDATLASIRKGDSKGGEFSPKRNTKVGNLEDKILDMFGIKTQVAGSDDSYLCNNDLTLASAQEKDDQKMGKKTKKDSELELKSVEKTSKLPSDDEENKLDHESVALKALEQNWGEKKDLDDFSNLEIAQSIFDTNGDKAAARVYLVEAINNVQEGDYVPIFYFIKQGMGDSDWAQEWKDEYWDEMLEDVEVYEMEIHDEDYD